MEATGVELITMLTIRKLLILGTATTAKKASLPDPLYVYCTKMLFAWSLINTTQRRMEDHHRLAISESLMDATFT